MTDDLVAVGYWKGEACYEHMERDGVEWPSQPVQGYLVRYPATDTYSRQFQHRMFGPNTDPGAVCPCCGKAFFHYLTLDASDPRVELQGTHIDRLPVYYCWACQRLPFFYEVKTDGTLGRIWKSPTGVDEDFPWPGYPSPHPETQAGLLALPIETQHLIHRINDSDDPQWYELHVIHPELNRCRHQVGGTPRLVQDSPWMLCPECENLMPFLYATGDDSTADGGITGNGWVQVLYCYCRHCRVVGCTSACD